MAEQLCAGAQPLAVALILAFCALLSQLEGTTAATQRQVVPNAHELSAFDGENPKYYFFNEITNEVQWDDPGDVPYEEESGVKYWLGKHGERLNQDPRTHQYTWVESYSDEHERPFFFNQETKVSTWDKPPDLAWRRVPANREEL